MKQRDYYAMNERARLGRLASLAIMSVPAAAILFIAALWLLAPLFGSVR